MKVLILTPAALPTLTGNAVTVERWRRGLVACGVDPRVLATEGLTPEALAADVAARPPDLVHAYHAFRSGRLLPAVPAAIPAVVSLPGTDLDRDVLDPARRPTIEAALERARAIATQSAATLERAAALYPRLRSRLHLLPKALLWLGDAPFDLRARAACGPADFLVFHPAGVRPVKGNVECLLALDAVRAARPHVRAVFAGPALDAAYAARFRAEVDRRRDFARWIESVPLEAMRAAYGAADAVLNSSRSEGLSNVVLEAHAAGKPVLASDIPGNRAAGGDAALYYRLDDPADLGRQALRLADDPALRAALASAGCALAARAPSPRDEAEALVALYRRVIGGPDAPTGA